MSHPPHYEFLRPNEQVIHSVEFTGGVMVATDRRVVVQRWTGVFAKVTSTDDFDYAHLAHIGVVGKSYRTLGIVVVLLSLPLFIVINEFAVIVTLVASLSC